MKSNSMKKPAMFAAVILILPLLWVPDALSQSVGSFVRTGNMTTPRAGHAATLLQDGRVLLTGGGTSSAEVYDPSTGTFSPTGSMHASRAFHTSTLLADGRVLIAGGACGCSAAEVYDPSSGTFTLTGSMISPRAFASSVLLKNGKVLVAGNDSFELYDPKSGIFSLAGGRGRLSPAFLLLDGSVFVGNDTFAQKYDPETNAFTTLLSGTHSLFSFAQAATALANGQILFAGGSSGWEVSISRAVVLDPSSGEFQKVGELGLPRDFHTTTLLRDGRVLIAGGYNGEGPDSITGTFSSVELYDPGTRIFRTIGHMMSPRDAHTATLLRDGRVLIAGGGTGNSSAELFVPDHTLGAVPALSMNSSQYCLGEPWQMRLAGATAFTGATLMGTWDGTPWSSPDWRTTGSDGSFVENQTFFDGAVGDHLLWIFAADKVSNAVSFKVSPCRVSLTVSSLFRVGAPWTLKVVSSLPDAVVTLNGVSNGTPWQILDWGRTQSDGSFVMTGVFPPGVEGQYQLQIQIGTEESNLFRFTVLP
jgi:Galactose oxidase, central domain